LVDENYALFARIIPTLQTYKCPADYSKWQVKTTPLTYVNEQRSYSMNSYIGTPAPGVVQPISINSYFETYLKVSQLAADQPDNRFVFMDVNPASICTPAFGVDMTLQTWIHLPSFLHRQGGVVAFADGHIEVHRWQDRRTRVQLPNGSGFIPHGTASPNNPDLNWISTRTSSKK